VLEHTHKGKILFDPSITCKKNLAECFRIFTDLTQLTSILAQRYYTIGVTIRVRPVTAYTDGACFNNSKLNAQCGSGVYFGPNDTRNVAFHPLGNSQSNQAGEIIAIMRAASAVPRFIPLKIISDLLYAINGLTKHLSLWEDRGWIGIKNTHLFRATAGLLKQRTATTSFQWTKGHARDRGNKEADRLAKKGVNKLIPNNLSLDIPKEFDLQGAKLSALSQTVAYQGIMECKPQCVRPATALNVQQVREALWGYHNELETDETIWKGTQNHTIRLQVRQFLFKAMHSTQKIGSYWAHILSYEDHQFCTVCNTTKLMEHILLHCRAGPNETIWRLARNLWPHNPNLWPQLNIGTLLGCGTIHLPVEPAQMEHRKGNPPRQYCNRKGASRFLQIVLSESLHLIWVMRCE
jgi:ribonuclease HI